MTMSPLICSMVIDWIMKETVKQGRYGILWTLIKQLDDIEFADDVSRAFITMTHPSFSTRKQFRMQCECEQCTTLRLRNLYVM